MNRKAFCYSIPGEKNMTKIITSYNKFLKDVDYVKGVEGDGEFRQYIIQEVERRERYTGKYESHQGLPFYSR